MKAKKASIFMELIVSFQFLIAVSAVSLVIVSCGDFSKEAVPTTDTSIVVVDTTIAVIDSVIVKKDSVIVKVDTAKTK